MVNETNKNQYFWNFTFTATFLILILAVTYIFRSENKMIFRISLFDFALLILAAYRLTHLIVYNDVMNWLHNFLAKFNRGPFKTLFNLTSCPWCTGIWVAGFLGFIYFLTPWSWFFIFVLALAGAAIILKIIADKVLRS